MSPRVFVLCLTVLLTLVLGLTAFNLRMALQKVPTVAGAPLAQCEIPAVTVKPLGSGGKTVSSSEVNVQTTPPMNIQANTLALLWVTQTNSLGGTPIVRDPNRTWQLVDTSGTQLRKLHVYRSLSATTTNSSVTIGSPKPLVATSNPNIVLWHIHQHANVNLSGAKGAGAIGQVVSAGSDDGSPLITALVMPLGPPQSSRSAVTVGVMALGNAMPFVPGQGFTVPASAVASGGFAEQVEFRPDF